MIPCPPTLRIGFLSALLLLSLGCSASTEQTAIAVASDKADGPAWFEDISDRVCLDFVHDPGPTGDYFMPQSMGSGCAFLDFDGDGWLDIYLLQDAGPNSKSVNRLYRQLPSGTFQDVTAGSGLDVAGHNRGVAIADVNNDGRPDVLLTQYGGIKLFLNLGDGRFEDISAECGLINPLWGMSAAFLDYDRDGWLDLVVVNYLDYDRKHVCRSPGGQRDYCGPNTFPGTCSKLFHNRGSSQATDGKPAARVRFEDVSFTSGLGRLPGPGLGVVCADFDGDGWPDIFVSNDGQPNRLWINRHDGTFADEAVSRGVGYTAMGRAFAGMGIALGDINNDGLLDLFVTHLGSETNTLWKQGPRGEFRDATRPSGLASPHGHGTGFGTLLADFNNDGVVDLAVVNGRVVRGGPARDSGLGFWETYAERNQLFVNDGTGTFRDRSAANPALCGFWNVGRGLACGDFDNDGAPDLLVSTIGGRVRLLRNIAPERGHWLKVRAFDPKWKRDAYGAEVRVRAGKGEQLRSINAAESYLCSGSPTAHFGLGTAARFETILVTWPDGVRELFPGGTADRLVKLCRGEGRAP
ncbi:MAG TPA: CRTAC1 family protein [Gemmataceae bacterium]|nr:CRTAC1 family protein [Gemmataceae bacterium]